MRTDIKKKLVRRLWMPLVLRIEKARAVKKWHEGIKACDRAYEKIGKPRFYLFYDNRHDAWLPLVYERRRDCMSIKKLMMMGMLHIHTRRKSQQQDIKEDSFYYTQSAWGAKGCREDMQLMAQKQRSWVEYYLSSVSKPMAKINRYLNKK